MCPIGQRVALRVPCECPAEIAARRIDLEAVIGVIAAAHAAIAIFGNDADDSLALRRGALP